MKRINITLIVALAISAALTAHAQKVPAPKDDIDVDKKPVQTPPVQTEKRPEPKEGENDDDIVEMSIFEVTARDDGGYFSDQTLSSGRLATDVADLAANINIITKNQLVDMGAVDIGDLLEYGQSTQVDLGDFGGEVINALAFEGLGNANVVARARGLPLSRLVDNETVEWEVDQYNVERVDFYLGADAILFGNGSPGGATNFTKDRANLRRTWLKTWYRFGSNDEQRFELDVQYAIIPNKLGVRFEMLDYEGGNFRKFYYRKRESKYAALVFRPFRDTLLRLNYEQGTNRRQQAIIGRPGDSVSKWWYIDDPAKFRDRGDPSLGTAVFNPYAGAYYYYGGRNKVPGYWPVGEGNAVQTQGQLPGAGELPLDIYDYHKYSIAGPDSRYFQDYRDLRISLEQRLHKDLSFRAYYRTSNADQNSRFIRRNVPVPTLYADPLPPEGDDDPLSGRLYAISNWRYQKANSKNDGFSAALAWTPNFGKWWGEHRVTLTYDDRLTRSNLYPYQERVYELDADGNATNAKDMRRVNYFDPKNDSTWHLGFWNPVEPFVVDGKTYYVGFLPMGMGDYGQARVNRQSRQSYTAHAQSYWLNRWLVTSLGYRRDDSDSIILNPQFMPPGLVAPATVPSTTRLDYFDPIQMEPRMKLTQETTSASGVLHLNKGRNVSIFYGVSGNVGYRISNRVLPDAEAQADPARASSIDYGVRLNFFKNKLSVRASAYKTSQKDSYTNYAGWYLYTRAGRTDGVGAPVFEMAIPQPGGTYSSETYLPTSRPLDVWADLLAAENLITTEQKALYDKILGRMPNADMGSKGVDGMRMESRAEGYEVSVNVQPFRGTSIRLNYSYNKSHMENVGADMVEWVDTFYAAVSQLPDAVLDAPFDMTKLNPSLAENRPAAPYTNREVFAATYNTIAARDEDMISERSLGYGNRKHKFNIYLRQGITRGWLKGLSFGGGYSYLSGSIQARTRSLSEDGRSLNTDTIMGPATWNSNAFLSYVINKRIFGKRTRMTLQLNVNNIFRNEYKVQVLRVQTARTPIPGVGAVVQPVRNLDGGLIPLSWSYDEPRIYYVRVGIEF